MAQVGAGEQVGHLRVPWSGEEGRESIYPLLQAAVRAGLPIWGSLAPLISS